MEVEYIAFAHVTGIELDIGIIQVEQLEVHVPFRNSFGFDCQKNVTVCVGYGLKQLAAGVVFDLSLVVPVMFGHLSFHVANQAVENQPAGIHTAAGGETLYIVAAGVVVLT